MAGQTDGRPDSSPPAPRYLLMIDLEGRLTVPRSELRDGETLQEMAERVLVPVGFDVRLVLGTIRTAGL